MKWTVVVLLVIVLVILWTTRKSSEYSNPLSDADKVAILAPGGISLKSVSLAGVKYLATSQLSDLNAIVSLLQTSGWKIQPFTSVPMFSSDSGSLAFRICLRALAYGPFIMQIVCNGLNIQPVGSASLQQAAYAFLDMYNLGIKGDTSVGLTNLNGAIGSNTPFASQQDFINRFNTTGTLDTSIIYMLGYILGGFNSWVTTVNFDTTYQPSQVPQYTQRPYVTWTAAGTDLPNQPMNGTVTDCKNACNDNNCLGFSWPQNADPNSRQQCYLKQNMSTAVPNAGSGWVSYINDRAPFQPSNPITPWNYTKLQNVNVWSGQNDIKAIQNSNPDQCAAACGNTDGCNSFVFARPTGTCYLKSSANEGTGIYDQNLDAYLTYQNPYTQFVNTNRGGGDIRWFTPTTLDACLNACDTTSGCEAVVIAKNTNTCWLKGPGGANTTTGTTHDTNSDYYVNTKKWVGYARNEPANAWDVPPPAAKAAYP